MSFNVDEYAFGQLQLQPVPSNRRGQQQPQPTATSSSTASSTRPPSLPTSPLPSPTSITINFNQQHQHDFGPLSPNSSPSATLQAHRPHELQMPTTATGGLGPLTISALSDSFSRTVSPTRPSSAMHHHQPLDMSLRSATSASSTLNGASVAAAIASAAQTQNAAVLNEMLQRSRDGLHKLQADLEVERARRLAGERDLADVKRDLSNERLTSSSGVHQLQKAADKEANLLRELALAGLLEERLRAELKDEVHHGRREKEDRIRLQERAHALEEEARHTVELLRQREDELSYTRDQSAREASSLRRELHSAHEELAVKGRALADVESGMKAVGEQLVAMDADKAQREVARLKEEHLAQQRLTEAQVAFDAKQIALNTVQASADSLRAENVRLLALMQENALKMSRAWDAAHAEATTVMESKLSALNQRIAELNKRQHALGKMAQEAAVHAATLQERLNVKTAEADILTREVTRSKLAHDQLTADHAEQARAMQQLAADNAGQVREMQQMAADHAEDERELQARYQTHLAEQEVALRDRFLAAQLADANSQRKSFEVAMEHLSRELDRAVHLGVSGADGHADSVPRTPTSALALGSDSDSASSFFTSALSAFQSSLNAKISTGFSTVHAAAERREYDMGTRVALLQQDVSFHTSQADERRAGESALMTRLQELTAHSSAEAKKLKAKSQESELLLAERANVIREVKKRYKREQATNDVLKAKLVAISKEHAATTHARQAELEAVRSQAQTELSNSLAQADAIHEKRLSAEHRLRQKAEEEAERYVRQCQEADSRVALLQQENQSLVTLFKGQQRELATHTAIGISSARTALHISTAAAHAAAAETDARIARMRSASSSPTAAAINGGIYSPNW